MTAGATTKRKRIPPDRLAEAGVWVARLHGDDRTPAMEAGFRQWLQADAVNERAFELMTDIWEDSQNLRRVVPFAHEVEKPRPRRWRFFSPLSITLATATAIALALVSVLYFASGTVVTGVGEQRLLALDDGSRVFLNTATRVAVRYSEQTRSVELEAGEALFDVARDAKRPFIVQVGDRQIRALGTSFVVRRDEQQLAVTLVEGAVAVEAFTLTPGQRLVIPVHEAARVETTSADKATAWRRGQIILDDTSLASAVAEMNRYNATKLVVESTEARDLIVNGLFQAGDSVNFANAVAQTYGLRVIERRHEIVLSGTPQSAPDAD